MFKIDIFIISFLVAGYLGLINAQTCNNIQVNPNCTSALQLIQTETKVTYPPPTHTPNVSAISENFELYGGRFINDFGEYASCQASNESHYFTMYFNAEVQGQSLQAGIGFCAPAVCSADDIYGSTVEIISLYNTSYMFDFAVINVTTCGNITVYDPVETYDNELWSTILVFVIMGALVLCTILGSAMNAYHDIRDAYSRPPSQDSLIDDAGRGNTLQNNDKKKREYRGFAKFLDCFDARKNFDKIVHVKYSKDYDKNLEVFNGFRVFFFLYVVYGHTYLFGTTYVDNPSDIYFVARSWTLLIVYSALYAVDAFFFMSGFFVAFLLLGKLKKMRASFGNFGKISLHRFFRIWPTYAFAVLFFWKIMPRLGSGPLWFQMTQTTQLCDQGRVIENLTFTDDILVSSANYCYGWGWYLSNDFQMFLLTPIFLWIYLKNKKMGVLCMSILILISYILALIIGGDLGVKAAPPTTGGVNDEVFTEYYVKPYIRLPPYFLGVLFGLMYKEYKIGEKDEAERGFAYKVCNFSRTLFGKWFLQIGGLALMLYVVLMLRPLQFNSEAWSPAANNIIRCFQKSVYVIAMAMMILPSLAGEDTYLKRFMSHPLLVPLYRLSFTAYLVHLSFVYRSFYIMTASFHYTIANLLYQTLANGVVSFVMALILSLLMEVPTANVESTYLTRSEGSRNVRDQGKGPAASSPVENEEPAKNIKTA